ncbi:MAG: DegV family protein [Ruminococcus sp.]|nr:DegV family protein [Ruminococcus sp.]
MRKVKIVTDSCSDLKKSIREKYDIDYLQMYTVRDGKETAASLDWEYYSPKELYDTIRDGNRVTTTQVPAVNFERGFKQFLEDGFDVVYIACSSKLSGSVHTGRMVAKEMLKDYPVAKIRCVDSFNASAGEGLVAVRAAQLRDEGLDADAIADRLDAVKNHVNQFVTVHSLNALRAAGRVKASAAFFGNLLGVKPILISDKNGDNVALKKVKGRYNSIAELAELTADSIILEDNPFIYVVHSDCEDEAKETEKLLLEKIPGCRVEIGYIGPIIGASIGADALGVFSWGKSCERFSV